MARECRRRRGIYGRRPNSSLKLTVRPLISRRPSRLPRLEFCTASRRLHRHYRMRRKRRAARSRPPSGGPQFNVKTLGRHGISLGKIVASSSRTLPLDRKSVFTVREPRASQSDPKTLKSHCRFHGVNQFTMLRPASRSVASTSQFTASPAGVECLCRAQSANVSA